MGEFSVTFSRSACKEIEALDASVVKRLFPRIEALADEPRPRGCRKIRGARDLWRIRVGDYRVIYAIHGEGRAVDIIAVRHRREAYR